MLNYSCVKFVLKLGYNQHIISLHKNAILLLSKKKNTKSNNVIVKGRYYIFSLSVIGLCKCVIH